MQPPIQACEWVKVDAYTSPRESQKHVARKPRLHPPTPPADGLRTHHHKGVHENASLSSESDGSAGQTGYGSGADVGKREGGACVGAGGSSKSSSPQWGAANCRRAAGAEVSKESYGNEEVNKCQSDHEKHKQASGQVRSIERYSRPRHSGIPAPCVKNRREQDGQGGSSVPGPSCRSCGSPELAASPPQGSISSRPKVSLADLDRAMQELGAVPLPVPVPVREKDHPITLTRPTKSSWPSCPSSQPSDHTSQGGGSAWDNMEGSFGMGSAFTPRSQISAQSAHNEVISYHKGMRGVSPRYATRAPECKPRSPGSVSASAAARSVSDRSLGSNGNSTTGREQPSAQSRAPACGAMLSREEMNEKLVKTPKDLLLFSKKSKRVPYKPYTVSQYRRDRPHEYYELGKLPPDLANEDLLAKKAVAERVKIFSSNLSIINKRDITHAKAMRQGDEAEAKSSRAGNPKKESARERALRFSKQVRPPKQRAAVAVESAGGGQESGKPGAKGHAGYADDRTGVARQEKLQQLLDKHQGLEQQVQEMRRTLGL